jgi:hypothetical protein
MKRTLLLLSLTSFMLLSGKSASAEVLAYSDPNSGDQQYPGNLALDFTVNQAIDVSALGVFAPLGHVIGGPITVGIWNTTTATLITSFEFTNTGVYTPAGGGSFDILQSITDVILNPGNYAVDAVGFGSPDPNGNINLGSPGPTENSAGGLLNFTGSAYDGTTGSLDLPTTCAGCVPGASNQFDAGTFEFAAAATPEPGTFGLFGLGSTIGFAILRRKRK